MCIYFRGPDFETIIFVVILLDVVDTVNGHAEQMYVEYMVPDTE